MRRTLLTCMLLLASCGHPAAIPRPAPTSADQQMAEWLLSVQTGIESIEPLVATNPGLKDPLNRIIAGYNAAESSYLAFHAAVSAGNAPDATALKALIQQLVASIGTIQSLYAK